MPLLSLHGAVAAVIAAAQSGLFTFATLVWLRPASVWPDITAAALIVFVTVSLCYALPRAAVHVAADDLLIVCARVPLGATMVWAAGALMVAMIAAPLGGHAGWLATLKTVILAAAGVALARARRSTRFVELGWLTYPVLLIGLAKLFLEDLSVSEPRMLVIAFTAYGVALTAASRVIAVRRP
jgi:hypothetical protein